MIEKASLEDDHVANELAEVGARRETQETDGSE